MMQVRLSEQEWIDKYKPITNPRYASEHPEWNPEDCPFGGQLFDCLGADGKAVLKRLNTHPETVWTLLDDGDRHWIKDGFHFVNREGYFITAEPWHPDHFVEVSL